MSIPLLFSDLLPCTGAAEAAAGASERPLHGHDLSAQAVSDSEHKGPEVPIGIPGIVICIFSYDVNHLVYIVFDVISIISFITCHH